MKYQHECFYRIFLISLTHHFLSIFLLNVLKSTVMKYFNTIFFLYDLVNSVFLVTSQA